MAEVTVGDAAHIVKQVLIAAERILSIVYDRPGELPEKGCFSTKRWAAKFENTEQTIREWIVRYNIPHRVYGRTAYVDAEDMKRAMPVIFGKGE